MILFENPYLLGLGVPLFALWLLLFRRQSAALAWISRNISPRFRERFTIYGNVSMPLHLSILLFMGIPLILACAGPYISGRVEEQTRGGTIVLVLDASLSMVAKDTGMGGKHASRLKTARLRAERIMNDFPGHSFALMTFSGITVVHAPPTRDLYGVRDALRSLSTHAYQSTGSSLKGVLARLLRMAAESEDAFQAIIFSDGELPRPENYNEELAALAKREVRVHTAALGSTRGVMLNLFDPEQVRRGVTRPTIVKKVRTRRRDRDLKRIASKTDAEFIVANKPGSLRPLKRAVSGASKSGGTATVQGKKDLSLHFLAFFLFCFLGEVFLLEKILRVLKKNRGSTHPPSYQALLLIMVLIPLLITMTGCEISAWKAHALNEKGLVQQSAKRYDSARGDFEKSAAYRVKEEVPTYNQANGHLKKGEFKKAHKIYERAMGMRPDLAVAYYNGGIALYRWGIKELDVKKCRFKRTKNLWSASLKRFQRGMQLNYEQERDGPLGDTARLNAEHVREQLAELAKLEKKCAANKKKNKGGGKDNKKQDKKDKSKQKNKKDKDKKKDQDKRKKDKKDKKKGGQDDKGRTAKKPRMSPGEKKKVKAALKRIKKTRRGKKFEQSKQQQIQRGKPGKKGKKGGGSPILW